MQLAVQMAISTALIITIGWIRPFDSIYANRLELFNESITVGTLYTLLLFTDFVQSADGRHSCGYIFISLILVFAVVHLTLLIKASVSNLKFGIMRYKW